MTGEEDRMVYDFCVIGAGMIGSSAARHLSSLAKTSHLKVLLIGPSEPKEKFSRDVFGAWYDEARITRDLDATMLWAMLANRSIDRYRALEEESGIHFYEEVGCVAIGQRGGKFTTTVKQNMNEMGVPTETLIGDEITSKFPYLDVAPYMEGVYQAKRGGYVNPRKLVKAQIKVAGEHGCHVIDDVAKHVTEHISTDGSKMLLVKTAGGATYYTKKALLATGAFTNIHELLPKQLVPDITLLSQVVIKLELGERDLERLKDMPSMLYKKAIPDEQSPTGYREDPQNYNAYILPPVKYPDGRSYLKLGHGDEDAMRLTSSSQVVDWFRGNGGAKLSKQLFDIINELIPGMDVLSVQPDTCVTVHTPQEQPFIDMVTTRLGVALGGNGYAAKSCDELGRIAARMIFDNEWDTELPRETFKIKYKSNIPEPAAALSKL